MLGLLALNSLGTTDIIFFCVLGGLVALCIAVYFLIPVLNRKQYKERRENLKKREVAFQSNIRRADGAAAGDMQPDEASAEVPQAGEALPGDSSAAVQAADPKENLNKE